MTQEVDIGDGRLKVGTEIRGALGFVELVEGIGGRGIEVFDGEQAFVEHALKNGLGSAGVEEMVHDYRTFQTV